MPNFIESKYFLEKRISRDGMTGWNKSSVTWQYNNYKDDNNDDERDGINAYKLYISLH